MEYKKQTGHCFSCGKLLNYNGPCHFCEIDFIILEEMTHFGNAWNNWGNSVFISNSMPTITTRGEIDTKFRSEIYTKCMAMCEPMCYMGMGVNQWNIYRIEERMTEPPIQECMLRTWNNLTLPLNYAAATRIRECKNQTSMAIPLLEEQCLKKIFSILKDNYKLCPHRYKKLPLPPTMISKMMRIFSSAEYLIYVPNPACDCVPRIHMQMSGKHALGECKLK